MVGAVVLLAVVIVVGSFPGGNGQEALARVAAALPPLPDLRGRPDVLRDRMQQAQAVALQRATTLDGLAELGRLFHANGFTAEAEACWHLLQTEQPDDARWIYYLADVRRSASDPAGMAGWLTRTTELAPDYAPAWLRLAEVQFKSGQTVAAARSYQRRLALVPDDPYAPLGLARIAMLQDRRDDARRLFEQIVTDSPEFPAGHQLYAGFLAAEGDTARAATERRRGRETGRFREADDPWLDELLTFCFDYDQLCLRGSVDSLTRHGDRGKWKLERAIQLRPDAPYAYELLGNLYLDLDDAASARSIYEQGLRQARSARPSTRHYINLARAYGLLRQPAEAVRVAREGLVECGEEWELFVALGIALGDLGDREGAVAALRTAVTRHPLDADANHRLAVALLAVHQLEEAVAALHQSLAADPTFPSTLALLGQIEIDSGRWSGAIEFLQPLYDANPELPEAREKMVYCRLHAGADAEKSGDVAAAEHHYRAGLVIAPEDADLNLRLGALLLVQRRFVEAIKPLEVFHRLQPDHPQGALFLGQACFVTGRRDEARQILTAGVELAERAGNVSTAQHCRDLLRRLP